MSNENNLLLQTAHLRNAGTIQNDNERNNLYQPVPMNGFEQSSSDGWRKHFTALNIAMTIGTLIIMIILIILICLYK